jgi:hypothetical protein
MGSAESGLKVDFTRILSAGHLFAAHFSPLDFIFFYLFFPLTLFSFVFVSLYSILFLTF